MAKKQKIPKTAKAATLHRPMISPYASSPVVLLFGSNEKRYHVPDSLVQKLENVPGPDWAGEIHIRDVNADIGHVLIHFLHTGTYQTLNDSMAEDEDHSNDDFSCKEFQKAVMVLQAATTYGLSRLQELAQAEMKRQGRQMNLRCAIYAFKEDLLVSSPHANVWLQDYMSKKVQDVFKHTPDVFCDPNFFESIESPTLAKILARMIVTLYNEKLLGWRTPPLGNAVATTERNHGLDEAVPEGVESSVKQTPTYKVPSPANLNLAAVQSTISAPKGEDTAIPSGTVYEALNNENLVTETCSLIIPSPLFGLHTESITEVAPAPEVSQKNSLASLTKKEKRRLEKKLKSEAAAKERENSEQNMAEEEAPKIEDFGAVEHEGALVLDSQAEVQMIDPFAGLSKSQKKKLEKRLKEDATLAKRNEEDLLKKYADDTSRHKVESAFEVAREQEKSAFTTAEKGKEVGATRSKEEEEAWQGQLVWHEGVQHAEDTTNPITVDAIMSENSTLLERINATVASSDTGSGGKNEEQRAFLSSPVSTKTEMVDPEPVKSEHGFDLAANRVTGDDSCCLRYEHLSYREGWKQCKQCETYMRKIAVKLRSTGLLKVNGFE